MSLACNVSETLSSCERTWLPATFSSPLAWLWQEASLAQRDRATRYVSWISVRKKITFEKACGRWMILKVPQGHRNCLYLIGHISLPISGNNDSILHRFRDNATFTVTLRSPSFSRTQLKYKTSALSDSCVNISQIIHAIFPEDRNEKGFKHKGHWVID